MSYSHILIATDLSDFTEQLLKKGTQLGWLFEAKISLMHVVNSIPVYGYNSNVVEIESELVESATKKVKELGKQFNIPDEDIHVKIGSIVNVILEFCDANTVDLIAVGSHGRHGLLRLLGSCASGVVHGAKKDVFIVHH